MGVTLLIEHAPDEATGFRELYDDPRIRVEQWVDRSALYEPYGPKPAKRTYLWRVTPSVERDGVVRPLGREVDG